MYQLNHIKAVLRDENLRKLLLAENLFPLKSYIDFHEQPSEIQEQIQESLDNVLQAFAPFQMIYPSPVEQLPDDAWIYGAKGVYVVSTQDGSVVFSRKVDAMRYANERSAVSREVLG